MRTILLTILAAAIMLVGCDARGKKCASGEGVDPLLRWQLCGESCVVKDNKESCAAAKVFAGAACAYSVKKGAINGSACREGCQNGDAPSCAVKLP